MYVFTISNAMIGKSKFDKPAAYSVTARQWRLLHEAIGPVQAQDVGKRVYDCGGFLQVENNEQRDTRVEPY